jgi:superkiller protein 3
MSRGFVFQYARKWDEAASCFSRVCGILTEEHRERIRAQEEQAWCEVQLNRFDQAITGLREVIELLDDKEDSEEDKSRSYWRLGKAYWDLGGK